MNGAGSRHLSTRPWATAGPLLVLATVGATALSVAPGGAGQGFALPGSGLELRLQEIIWDDEDRIGRFRFVAPGLPEVIDTQDPLDADMMALCDGFALPLMSGLQPDWQQIVLSLASRPTPFGEYDPEAVQVFEGFEILDGTCVWEEF